MKNTIIVVLMIALLVSWLGFMTWLERPVNLTEGDPTGARVDVIHVWLNELLGSPDESYYYELADCWNATNPHVQIKMAVMSHAGYESKLRVAIASGQPPDVCQGGLEVAEPLQYSGKTSSLAVEIPEDIYPVESLEAMGPLVAQAGARDGKLFVFPLYRYLYGGFLMVNRTLLLEAGFDDEVIRRDGWTFEQFRQAAKSMTKDVDGDGTTDVWGFGASLKNLEQLLDIEFGPGIWGKEVARRGMLGYDEKTQRWVRHSNLSEDDIYQAFLLFHQLHNVDKTWNPQTLSSTIFELHDEVDVHQRLGMAFCSVPWMPKMRKETWDLEVRQGVEKPHPFPDLTAVWMPTLRAGDRPSPIGGVYGLSVLRQEPYKGDAHTRNACRVALYLTHPVHLARSQLRSFRHLPPDPQRFGAIFPELIDLEDPWVRFYNEAVDSGYWHARVAQFSDMLNLPAFQQVLLEKTNWLRRKGLGYLEEVIYEKSTPREAARRFHIELKQVVDKTYETIIEPQNDYSISQE